MLNFNISYLSTLDNVSSMSLKTSVLRLKACFMHSDSCWSVSGVPPAKGLVQIALENHKSIETLSLYKLGNEHSLSMSTKLNKKLGTPS